MPISTDIFYFWYRTKGTVTQFDDWRLNSNQNYKIAVIIKDLLPHCKDLIKVPLDQIAYVSMHLSPEEFEKICRKNPVDISYPGIIVPGLRNPFNLPYVLIDGRHRMHKMKQLGITESKFYIISQEVFAQLLLVPR